ncbi:MAG: MBL fold metallo-hydrolase [Akkermansiaceae bacterium]|jgi:glyoxylase-like metal-dependent hydrolase (beta-lactamase superfamily II)
MTLHTYTGGFVDTNGYLLVREDKTCVVIDAPAGIARFVEEQGFTPTHLLLTHQHFDHVDDVAALSESGARVYAFRDYAPDVIMEDRVREMGLPVNIPPYTVDEVLEGKDLLTIDDFHFSLSHVPGHSPESLCFHLDSESFLFAGDTLFNGSIGRTDLPGGNHDQLLDAIRKSLYALPNETAVFPGHGPQTSIGHEKKTNPFCPQP